MKRDSGQLALINFLFHYLAVTGRPATLGELHTVAQEFSQGLKGRSLLELLQKDQRFICREDQWGLADWAMYTAIDLETTGLSPLANRITEIALVRLWGTHVVAKWVSLVNPCRLIPAHLVQLIGISNEMVAEAPLFADLVPTLRAFIGDTTLIAHNAPFDKSFLDAELAKAGEEPLTNPWIDTVALGQRLLPQLPNRKLVTVATYFHIDCGGHHRALADAIMVAQIFAKMALMEDYGDEVFGSA